MTKPKTTSEITYKELGFPIIITNPKYTEFDGEKMLDISPDTIMNAAFNTLHSKPARLTGAEVKFIRTFMEMTQDQFAKKIGIESGTTVSKWENLGNKTTDMEIGTETHIRIRAKLATNKKYQIGEIYLDRVMQQIAKSKPNTTTEPIKIST